MLISPFTTFDMAWLIFIYGLLIGSFLNAWIWRLKHNRKISRGRSECPHCHTALHWYELIPVLSWLGLRGQCRTCQKPISIQYPIVELVMGLSWAGIFMVIQPHDLYSGLLLAVWLIVVSLMIAAFVFDARWMYLPDQFTLPAIAVALIWLIVRWIGFGEGTLALQQLAGAALFGGSFWALWYFSGGKWLGDGDIRLAVLMGLLLTTSQLMIAIFLSFNIGAIVGVSLIATGVRTRRDPIPFGPFLITGLLLSALFGSTLVNWYLNLFL